MPVGCLSVLSGASRRARRADLNSDSLERSVSSKICQSSTFGGILRNDSGIASNSLVSTSSTISSRSNVSFNPKIEKVVFDTGDAPSQIHIAPVTRSRCLSLHRPSAVLSRNNTLTSSSFLQQESTCRGLHMGQKIERRHLL